jgi:hypothetical protein
MDANFIQARMNATMNQIVAYEDAALKLSSGVQSYTLDTGQTRQTVTKLDLGKIQDTLDLLHNRYATYKARLSGCGTVTGRPAW